MSKTAKACEWAVAIANDASHGYDQANRWGPDYDCSALVISAWEQAGVPVKSKGATYTGNMKPVFLSCGFADVTNSINLATGAGLQKGDVLLNIQSHTALYLGNGQVVQASGNEKGGITGGTPGDQTGREIAVSGYYNFPWDCVLRYGEQEHASSTPPATASEPVDIAGDRYIVQSGDSLWAIAEKTLGNGALYGDLLRYNDLSSTVIHPGQVLKIPGKDNKTVQLTLKTAVWDALERKAKEQGLTVEALLEATFNGR